MAAAVSNSTETVSRRGSNTASIDFVYLCGRFLSLKKPILIPSLSAAITTIWGLKEKILIREEEPGIFVFLFKAMEEKKRVLEGGPWFFGGSMLVLADYDGLCPLDSVALNHLEIWVAVKGLRIGMRTEDTLVRLGNDLGEYVDFDRAAEKRRDPIQRVRIIHDVRRRILAQRRFIFSSEFSVLLETRYEKCHGICLECGLFGHGVGVCDNSLSPIGTEDLDPPSMVGGSGLVVSGLTGSSAEAVASAEESRRLAAENLGQLEMPKKVPCFSAGNSNSKLELTDLVSGQQLTETGFGFKLGLGLIQRSKVVGADADSVGVFGLDPMQADPDGVGVTIRPILKNPSVLGVRKFNDAEFSSVPEKRARHGVTPPSPKLAEALGLTEVDQEPPIASFKKKNSRILGSKNKVSRPSKKPGPQPPRVALNGDVAVKVSPNKGKGIV